MADEAPVYIGVDIRKLTSGWQASWRVMRGSGDTKAYETWTKLQADLDARIKK